MRPIDPDLIKRNEYTSFFFELYKQDKLREQPDNSGLKESMMSSMIRYQPQVSLKMREDSGIKDMR